MGGGAGLRGDAAGADRQRVGAADRDRRSRAGGEVDAADGEVGPKRGRAAGAVEIDVGAGRRDNTGIGRPLVVLGPTGGRSVDACPRAAGATGEERLASAHRRVPGVAHQVVTVLGRMHEVGADVREAVVGSDEAVEVEE